MWAKKARLPSSYSCTSTYDFEIIIVIMMMMMTLSHSMVSIGQCDCLVMSVVDTMCWHGVSTRCYILEVQHYYAHTVVIPFKSLSLSIAFQSVIGCIRQILLPGLWLYYLESYRFLLHTYLNTFRPPCKRIQHIKQCVGRSASVVVVVASTSWHGCNCDCHCSLFFLYSISLIGCVLGRW